MAATRHAQGHKKGEAMSEHISGTFDVTMNKEEMHEAGEDSGIGRMSLDKEYHGDLDATGVGEMLAAMTSTKGSAGYVAMEKVEGTLAGRSGSFFLQHTGIMNRGTPTLTVAVVPDSGTDELVGLSGQLMIRIVEGVHYYDFDYSLGDASKA
jgi:hypothetical protein